MKTFRTPLSDVRPLFLPRVETALRLDGSAKFDPIPPRCRPHVIRPHLDVEAGVGYNPPSNFDDLRDWLISGTVFDKMVGPFKLFRDNKTYRLTGAFVRICGWRLWISFRGPDKEAV